MRHRKLAAAAGAAAVLALAACGSSATPAPVTTTLDADDTDGLRVVPAGIESAAKDRDSVLRRNVDRASAPRWALGVITQHPARPLNELSYPVIAVCQRCRSRIRLAQRIQMEWRHETAEETKEEEDKT
jgi:hypothetical protein